jgi:hypothetical protein
MVVPVLAEILTDGVTVGFTVMMIVFEFSLAGLAHKALLATTHDTSSPVTNVLLEYVALFVPTALPFLFH